MKTNSITITLLLLLQACNGAAVKPTTENGASINISPNAAVWSNTPVSNTFLYRANTTLNSITVGSIDTADGSIVEHETLSTGANTAPTAIAMTPNHDYLYVANKSANSIGIYSVDQASGRLSFISNISTYAEPSKLLVHPNGNFLYTLHASNSQISTHTINPSTGALSFSSGISVYLAGAKALAMDPAGRVLFANSNSMVRGYAINPTTGALTYSGQQSPMIYDVFRVHPTLDVLYGSSWMGGVFWGFDFDPTNATTTATSSTSANKIFPYTTLDFDSTGDFAYTTCGYSNTIESYSVNKVSTYLNFQNSLPLPSNCQARGLQLSPDGKFLFVSCSDSSGTTLSFSINPNGSVGATSKSSSIPGAGIMDSLLVAF